jgi:hypothetical protein
MKNPKLRNVAGEGARHSRNLIMSKSSPGEGAGAYRIQQLTKFQN